MTGLTGAYVWNGGGTINNGNNAITIGQALLAPTGSGVYSIALTSSGAGYDGEPVVQISGGGGSGAAARAIMSGGVITGIAITNPGHGLYQCADGHDQRRRKHQPGRAWRPWPARSASPIAVRAA